MNAENVLSFPTWWERLIILKDQYFCLEQYFSKEEFKADVMIIDEGSYKNLQEELKVHTNEETAWYYKMTIIVVPRIGKSEVRFYKALKTIQHN